MLALQNVLSVPLCYNNRLCPVVTNYNMKTNPTFTTKKVLTKIYNDSKVGATAASTVLLHK